jgi:hypothetical protein
MKKDEFEKLWASLSCPQKGAAVEAFFHHVHKGAKAVRAGSVDFILNGKKYDIKGHKNACPRLDSVHRRNEVSILWYNWMSASVPEDKFPVVVRSASGMDTFEWVRFRDFSNFVAKYKKEKALLRSCADGDYSKRIKEYLKNQIHPIYNGRFPGKNRFVHQKDGMQGRMESPMVNSTYEKFDRTIALYTYNKGLTKM